MTINFKIIIDQIADEIKTWEVNSSLPHKAGLLIKQSEPWKYFSEDSFTQTFLQLNAIPQQFSFNDGFGQPAITLWSNENLRMELYFWNRSNTSVHSHAFAGAFTVLEGLSFQTLYDLAEINPPSSQGTVHFNCLNKKHRFIYPGEVQEIIPGNSFCHDVIHINHPTITFIIRSNKPICPQMQILNNGQFGFDFIRLNEITDLNKKLSLLNQQAEKNYALVQSFLSLLPLSILFNLRINPSMWGFQQTETFKQVLNTELKLKLFSIHQIELEEVLTQPDFEDSNDPLAVLAACVYLHALPVQKLNEQILSLPKQVQQELKPKEKSFAGDIIYEQLYKLLA